MKISSLFALLIYGFSLVTVSADQQAERILTGVRHGAILQSNDMTGALKKNGKRYPIHLFLRGENIQFLFEEGENQNGFHMRMGNEKFDLFDIVQRKPIPMPLAKLDDGIKGTDVTYEDLAMRFLYWKNNEVVGEEKIKSQDCYKIRLINPDKNSGQYRIVYAWVHKKYGALMQVVGYNAAGKPLKKFIVSSLQKSGDVHTLKKMEVSTIDPRNKKVTGITYMEFDKPSPAGSGLKPTR